MLTFSIEPQEWMNLAQQPFVIEMHKEVADLAIQLRLAIRQFSLYGLEPVKLQSDITWGPLECSWWLQIGPPIVWGVQYRVSRVELLVRRGNSPVAFLKEIAQVEGLQNPIAFAATVRCLLNLYQSTQQLPQEIEARLQRIPGWVESIHVLESFLVAQGLAGSRSKQNEAGRLLPPYQGSAAVSSEELSHDDVDLLNLPY